MRMGVLEGKREGSRAAIKYAKEHGVMEEARVTLSGGIPRRSSEGVKAADS
ncbi:hypothetical protein D9611_014592 [Ephemerocybe angulata]|uniref:Uncharacterized protein n=1 Tax=Ephemerocybe angulata TaxID=980116 RepID=A0A8H5CAL5_9AGAR|nr:hypothetical protein D9611_014592 [Tulosesus angulatus]